MKNSENKNEIKSRMKYFAVEVTIFCLMVLIEVLFRQNLLPHVLIYPVSYVLCVSAALIVLLIYYMRHVNYNAGLIGIILIIAIMIFVLYKTLYPLL